MIGRGFECLGWVWFASCGEDLGYSYVLHMAYTLCYIGLRFDIVASCCGLWSLALGVGTYLELGQVGVLWDGMLLRYRTACKAAAIMYVRKIGKIPS